MTWQGFLSLLFNLLCLNLPQMELMMTLLMTMGLQLLAQWLFIANSVLLLTVQYVTAPPTKPKYIPKRLRWKLPTIAEWIKSWAASAITSAFNLFTSFINYLLPTSRTRPYSKSYNKRLNRRGRSWYRRGHVKRNNITCSVRPAMVCRSLGMRGRPSNSNFLFNMYWSNLSNTSIYQAWSQRSKFRPTFA